MKTLTLGLSAVLVAALCACGQPLEEWEGDLESCDNTTQDLAAVLILDRQLTSPLAGWFGFATTTATDTYLLAPIEDAQQSGADLTFTVEWDLGGGSTPLDGDFDLTFDGDRVEGNADLDSSGSSIDCDVDLRLET
jgi:hypothetical protein